MGIEASDYFVLYLLDKNFHDAFANLHPDTLFLEHVQKWQKSFLKKKKAFYLQFIQVTRRDLWVTSSLKVKTEEEFFVFLRQVWSGLRWKQGEDSEVVFFPNITWAFLKKKKFFFSEG